MYAGTAATKAIISRRNWLSVLQIIEPEDDHKIFLRKVYVSDRKPVNQATLRSPSLRTNVFTNFRLVHPNLLSIIQPIVGTRERNKREKNKLTTLTKVFVLSHRILVDETLVSLFLCQNHTKRYSRITILSIR